MHRLILIGLFLTGMAAAQAPATPPAPPKGPGAMPCMPPPPEMGNPADRLVRVLKLDATKAAAVKKLFVGVQNDTAKLQLAMARKSIDRKELELADKPDLAAFRKNAEERAKISVDIEMVRTAAEIELKKVLSAEEFMTYLQMKNMREKAMRQPGPGGHLGRP